MSSNLIDLAVQHYGNAEAVTILIEDNPGLIPDSIEFELSNTVDSSAIVIRDEDDLKDKKVLNELNGKVIISE